jgi:hypothetical protein
MTKPHAYQLLYRHCPPSTTTAPTMQKFAGLSTSVPLFRAPALEASSPYRSKPHERPTPAARDSPWRAPCVWLDHQYHHRLDCSSGHGRPEDGGKGLTPRPQAVPLPQVSPQFNVAFLHHHDRPTLSVAAEVSRTRSQYHTHRGGLTVRGHAPAYVLHPEDGFRVASSYLGLVVVPSPSIPPRRSCWGLTHVVCECVEGRARKRTE